MLVHIQELKIKDDKIILNGKEHKIIISEKGYKFIYEDKKRLYLHKLIAMYKYVIPMKSIDRYDVIFKDNDKSNLNFDNIEIRLKSFVYDGKYIIKNIPYKTNEYISKTLMNELIEEGFLKRIPDCKYDMYVGKNGVVVRKDGQIRALAVSSDGYLRINYRAKNGKVVKKQLHRLVAQSFIPPYVYHNGDKVINHRDGNPKNNHVNNLEWVTQKENVIYSYKNGFVKRDFRIVLEDLETGKKKEFYSIRYLTRELKIPTSINKILTIFKVTEKFPLYGKYKFVMVNKESLLATDDNVLCKAKIGNDIKEFETLMRLVTYYGIKYSRISIIYNRYKPRSIKFKDVEIEFTKYYNNNTIDRSTVSLLDTSNLKNEKRELEFLIKKQALEEVLKI